MSGTYFAYPLTMLTYLVSFLILLAQTAIAQDLPRDLDFIETQNTKAMPFNIPINIDIEGNINLITPGSAPINFRPSTQLAWKKTNSLYIAPVSSNSFAFAKQDESLPWIQVKRFRWEAGIGLSALMKALPISAGLTPYRGGRRVMIRKIKSEKEKTPNPAFPKNLADIEAWQPEDRGSFQTYGGIHFYAGINYTILGLSSGVTFQNLFNVVITKLKNNKVQLSIMEESLSKRRIDAGAGIASAKLNFFNGKQLATHFTLDLNNPADHDLYRLGIKGHLTELQDKLPQASQKMEWKGREKLGYLGIPSVVGKHFTDAEYEMNFSGEKEILDLKSKRSSGWFLPLRNHNKMVYQTNSALTLFWYSEMNKTDADVFNRKFMTPGKLMGAKGFNADMPDWKNMGSTLSQLGMSFTRKEIEGVTPELLEEILVNFRIRCSEMNQPCANSKNFNKIAKSLRSFLKLNWDQVKDKIGFLMLDEPSLIYAYIKSIKSPKSVYFKFLNQKYQSMEGAAPIEI